MNKFVLPFDRVTARAIILRRGDGAILGALHHQDGRFAPPGGGVEAGEVPERAVLRELEEEGIRLIGPDAFWMRRLAVDYYPGYREMNLWYIFLVEDVQIGNSPEFVDVRWFDQTQDVWYPLMREKMFLAIKEHVPDMLKVEVSVLESW